MTRYWSRPFQIDAEKWTDVENPPMGVHDAWRTTGTGTVYGYLPGPHGDKLAWVGCWVVRYPSGETMALDDDEFNQRFQELEDDE